MTSTKNYIDEDIEIIYEDNHILVVVKPANIPVQEDETEEKDLLNILKKYIKIKYEKKGNVYLALIHRLDRPTGGIMVFAKTSKAASRLSQDFRENKVEKKYFAVLVGKMRESRRNKERTKKERENKVLLIDYLYKDTKEKKSYVCEKEKGKKAELEYTIISVNDNPDLTLVSCNLLTGRHHQIRVQFSSRNFPIYGDIKYAKYLKKGKKTEELGLFAYYLSFIHPTTKEKMVFKKEPNYGIFTYFKNDILDEIYV